MAERHLLVFVCTGNICRSPMAEHMMKARLGEKSNWDVVSAGLATGFGMPASATAQRVMAGQGIGMSTHMSKPLDHDVVDMASIIVVMTEAHLQEMERLYPEAREKIFLLRSFDHTAGNKEVGDPIGFNVDIYEKVKEQIERSLPGLQEFMNQLDM